MSDLKTLIKEYRYLNQEIAFAKIDESFRAGRTDLIDRWNAKANEICTWIMLHPAMIADEVKISEAIDRIIYKTEKLEAQCEINKLDKSLLGDVVIHLMESIDNLVPPGHAPGCEADELSDAIRDDLEEALALVKKVIGS